MKQLKRILTLVLALTMIVASVAFAEVDPRLDGRWTGSGYCRGPQNRKSALSACITQNGKYSVTINKLDHLVLENTFDCDIEKGTMKINVLYEKVLRTVNADYGFNKKGALKVDGTVGDYTFSLTFKPVPIAKPSFKINKKEIATVKTNAKADFAVITDGDRKVLAIGRTEDRVFKAPITLLPGKNIYRAFAGTLDMEGKMIPVAVGDTLDLTKYGVWLSNAKAITKKG